MKVLVIGGTGNLGREVVTQALASGHLVTALARNPNATGLEHDSLRLARGDVRDSPSVQRAVAGQEAVISCLGSKDRKDRTLRTDAALNTIAAMRRHNVARLIVFSAFGVGDSSEQLKRNAPFFGRIILPLLLRAPFADMAHMEAEVRASDLAWTIVRPCALTRKPATGTVTVALDDATKLGGTIPYADVAAFMVEQLTSDLYVGKAPAISG